MHVEETMIKKKAPRQSRSVNSKTSEIRIIRESIDRSTVYSEEQNEEDVHRHRPITWQDKSSVHQWSTNVTEEARLKNKRNKVWEGEKDVSIKENKARLRQTTGTNQENKNQLVVVGLFVACKCWRDPSRALLLCLTLQKQYECLHKGHHSLQLTSYLPIVLLVYNKQWAIHIKNGLQTAAPNWQGSTGNSSIPTKATSLLCFWKD